LTASGGVTSPGADSSRNNEAYGGAYGAYPAAGANWGASATNNTAVGRSALGYSTDGYYNTAVGDRALLSTTSGYGNTAVGIVSLTSNTTGQGNSAFGRQALQANTIGSTNNAFGQGSLASVTGNDNNCAFGTNSLNLDTGSDNAAFGHRALEYQTAANYNTALGAWAGRTNITGSNNINIGYRAGYYNTSGNKVYIDSINRGSEAAENSSSLITGQFDADTASQWVQVAGAFKAQASIQAGTSSDSDTSYHPAFRIKKITGTTGANEGDETTTAHNLTASKILSINAVVWYTSTQGFPPEYQSDAENQYSVYFTSSYVAIHLSATNSGNIKSKSYTVTIMYEYP
jgi:hypothetical protein